MSKKSREISTFLASALLMCLTLAAPGYVHSASSSSLTGTIDVASGNATIQVKTDAGALVVVNGRQARATAAAIGALSASFAPTGMATIAVTGKSRPGFSMLLSLPVVPSVAGHMLPAMTFSYDGTSPPGASRLCMVDRVTKRLLRALLPFMC